MAHYRCYLLGDTGNFAAVEKLEADTDEVAIAVARWVSGKRPREASFQLWNLGRKVHAEPLEASVEGAIIWL
jgi:hypothetical protein